MANGKTHIITSFSMDDLPENHQALKTLKELAAKDGWSFSRIVSEAINEYVKRHSPGNPQLILGHWTEALPMPQTVCRHENSKMERISKPKGRFDPSWFPDEVMRTRCLDCGAIS